MSEGSSKKLHVALWVVQGLLAAAFLMAGGFKLASTQAELVEQGMAYAGRYAAGTIKFIGAAEIAGALGLILPSALRILPKLTPAAAVGLLVVMSLAAVEHATNAEMPMIVPNVVLGGLAAFVAWGRLRGAPIDPK